MSRSPALYFKALCSTLSSTCLLYTSYVAELREKMLNSVSGVAVDYMGINVADDTKLRKELREAGVEYSVVKNTMLRLAVKDTDLADMAGVFTGSTALALSAEDPIAPARILNKYAEGSKGKFSLKGGYLEGDVYKRQERTQCHAGGQNFL